MLDRVGSQDTGVPVTCWATADTASCADMTGHHHVMHGQSDMMLDAAGAVTGIG